MVYPVNRYIGENTIRNGICDNRWGSGIGTIYSAWKMAIHCIVGYPAEINGETGRLYNIDTIECIFKKCGTVIEAGWQWIGLVYGIETVTGSRTDMQVKIAIGRAAGN